MTFTEKSFKTLSGKENTTVVYSDWGPADAEPVVCVHGLTGNGRDFDVIAASLMKQGYRVLAIDLPGRGRSDYLKDPLEYNYHNYVQILGELLTHAGCDAPGSVNWIGTSLGGLLGMRVAGAENSPIKKLILNDIGPEVPQADLDLISEYLDYTYEFESYEKFLEQVKLSRGPGYGPMTEEHWNIMAQGIHYELPNGKHTYAFDPEIKQIFKTEPIGELNLWPFWDNITCPTLIIRGALSTLFPQNIADQMMSQGPGTKNLCTLELWDGCGHVPSLMHPPHIEIIQNWLKAV